jgi:hypothetical protein
MSNVISFRPSPLSPFLGKWVLDPLSVSRDKVVKRALGDEGLKKLWACASIEERTQCLASDPELANRYQSVLQLGRRKSLVVTIETLAWSYEQQGSLAAQQATLPVLKVAVEGTKVIVHSIDTRPQRSGQALAYVFRLNKQWLLISERYSGRHAQYFPRSPVHRFYRSI